MEHLRIYGLENEFERIGDELYLYGNKKLTISIKNGFLVCRVGGGYMMIDQFLKSIMSKKIEILEEKTVSISPCKINTPLANQNFDGTLKENNSLLSPKRLRIPNNMFSTQKPTGIHCLTPSKIVRK